MMIERWIDGSQLQIEEYNGVPFVKQSMSGIAEPENVKFTLSGLMQRCLDDFFLFYVFIPSQ